MAQLRVVVVGHDVHKVGLRLFFIGALHSLHQICPVLEGEQPQALAAELEEFTGDVSVIFVLSPAEK